MPNSIYALLIACDFYFPNRIENETTFRSLRGCVRDISRVEEELLKGRLKVPPGHILKLKSSHNEADKTLPLEPENERPTYENIVAKFQEVTLMASAGDQVYIHYSGHGGRALTAFSEVKGVRGVDETIVPINIEDVSNRYLRDIELAMLLKTMVEKKLLVTVVLDSCHSGGMTRHGTDVAVRGTAKIDQSQRPAESLVAGREDLMRNWRQLKSRTIRGMNDDSSWLPDPRGYVLLAACRQDQSAIEFMFNGKEPCGALTHYLLNALGQEEKGITWKQIYDRIIGRITSQFNQTPQLYGETERQIFGLDSIPQIYAVNVSAVDEPANRLRLNTGAALGAAKGAGFAIYPSGTIDFTRPENRLGVAEITEIGATNSWAEIKQKAGGTQFQSGDQAVLIDSGVASLRGQVRLIGAANKTAESQKALEKIAAAIEIDGRGFLKTVESDKVACNYQIAITENGEYEILDPSGIPFPNLRPILHIHDESSAQKIVTRLIHLYKFQTIQQLKNPAALSPLSGHLFIEAFAAPPDAKSDKAPFNPMPLNLIDSIPTVKVGDRIYLNLRNEWKKTLNVAVLLLDADWSITQVLPPKNQGQTITLEPGREKSIWKAPRAFLSPLYQEGFNTFKVFGTLNDTSFRFLELPPLNNPIQPSVSRAILNPLEELLADFNAERAKLRNVSVVAQVGSDWMTTELALRLIR